MCRSASVVVRRFGSLVGPAPSLVASKASVAVWCRLCAENEDADRDGAEGSSCHRCKDHFR